jgi:hypothetical protein
MNRIVFPLLCGVVVLVGCRPASAPVANDSTIKPATSAAITQWSGQHGGRETPGTEVVRTVAQWDAFWRNVREERPRKLDVAREMAVAIHLGRKRTGGFTAEIVRVHTQDGKRVIEYHEAAPQPGMMVTQELTTPWALGIIPRSDEPVTFEKIAASGAARRDK